MLRVGNDSGFAVLYYGRVDSVFVEIFLPSLPASTWNVGTIFTKSGQSGLGNRFCAAEANIEIP